MNTQRLLQLIKKAAFAVVAVFALSASTAMAQNTWYVSSTSGNNAFDGTSANVVSGLVGPKLTINGALAVAGDGDTIVVEAGAYTENVDTGSYAKAGGDTANLDDITFQVTAAGLTTAATVAGNLTVSTDVNFSGGTGEMVFNGATLLLTSRTLTVASGKLQFTGATTVTRVAGSVAGAAPTFPSNVTVNYNGGALASITAGLELPANLGTGVLTVNQTSGTLTFPSAVTANTFNLNGGATVTFSGDVTVRNTGGGITTAATVKVNAGNVQLNNTILTVAAGTQFTSTGTVTYKANATATPIATSGTTSIATFAFDVANEGVAGQTNYVATINVAAGTASFGTLSEDSATDTTPQNPVVTVEGHIALTTAGGTTLTLTSSNTTRGDINNGGTMALGSTTFSNSAAAPTALGTFTGNTSTLALTAVVDNPLPNIAAAGNVTITTAGASTLGTITSSAGSITVTGDQAAPWFNTVLGNITATAGSVTLTGDVSPAAVTANAGTINWNGMNGAAAAGNFSAAGITVGGTGTLTGNVTSTAGLSVTSSADFVGVFNVSGTATFAGGNTLSGLGGASSVGALVVNGALTTGVNAGTLTVTGTTTVSSSGGSVDLNGTTQFTFRGNVTGGQFTFTGAGSTVYLHTSNSTQSFTPGVNSSIYNLTVGGDLNRTVSLLQSVTVANQLTVEDDTNFDLTNKLVRITSTAANTVVLNDDAQVIASGDTGALSFEFNVATGAEPVGPEIVVTGAPATAPAVSNILINNANGAPEPLDIDNNIRITGIVSLINGGMELNNATATFSGSNAGVNRNVAGTTTQITTVGAGAVAGTYNLTYSGATGVTVAAGSELSTSVNNMTVATSGAGAPQVNVTGAVAIQGALTVNSGAVLGLAAVLTVPGNATVNGTVSGASALTLSGNGASHSVVGTISAPVTFAHNSSVAGSASNTNPALISGQVTVNATRAVTMTNMQQLTNVTVNGSLTLGMVDAAGAGVNDAVLYGPMIVNDGGSLTLTTNIAANSTVTIGSTTAATSASLDLGGFTLDMLGAAFLAQDNNTGASGNANLGSTGTVKLSNALSTFDANGATVPNLNVAANTTVTNTVVSGTLTVNEGTGAAASVAIGGTLWLAGNAALTDGNTVAFTGGQFETTGTTITASSNVTFADLEINSTGTTTFASSSSTARTFTATNYLHTKGGVDLGAQTLAIADATPVYVNGTYAATSGTVGFGAGTFDTTEKVVAIPNVMVTGALVVGLADATPDGMSVSGTLTFGAAGSISTDSNLSGTANTGDATFAVGDGATIYTQGGSFAAATNPSLGTGLTVRYGATMTTGAELAATVAVFRIDTGNVVSLQDNRSITTTTFDVNGTGSLIIDANSDNDNGFNVADGGQLLISGDGQGGGVINSTGFTAGEFAYAGAYSIVYDGSATSQTRYWIGSPTAVTVNDGSSVAVATLTLGANHTVGNLSAVGNDLIALAGNTLTVNGSITNGSAISGGTIAFAGSAAQTVDATGGLTLPNVIFNNASGITISGGNLTVTGTATFTAGVVMTGSNFIQLLHTNTVTQGFARTAGCVAGNVRKNVPGAGAAADRIEFPTCAADGSYRPAAVTFNTPTQVGAGTFLTVGHVETSPGGANNLPLTTQDDQGAALTIARYPAFHWTVTSSSTLSPSVNYDIELRAAGYTAFAGEDIERVRTIRRQGGASTNFWTLVGPTAGSNDNFAVSATEPVAIVRSAQGAIISTPGTLFTMGLESNMSATNPAAVSVNAGQTSTVDLSTVFSGGTGSYTYAITSGAATVATGAAAGNTLTVTGVGAGSTTLTVVATDALNDTRTATVAVTVNPAFAAGSIAATELNAGGTSTVDLSTVFSGGAAPITYAVASSDAAAATGAVASGTLTITAVAAGSATITVTATDATAQTATATVAVTVNAAMSATNPAVVSLTEGTSQAIDLSTVFAGGDGTYTYAATSAASNVTAAVASGTLTVTAADAYAAGTTIATVAVTVTATDGLGSSVTATVTVDVLPILGDLDGSGAPSAASASIALDYFLGLSTLTAKQQAAADFNGDGVVNAFDAALIFNAFLNGKDELAPVVAANLQFGAVQHVDGMVNIPLQIAGDLNDVVAASFTANIDPSKAKVVAVTSELDGEWIIKHTVSEEGQLRIAVAGLGTIPTEGTIATIQIQLTDAGAAFDLVAEGAVNNNSTDALEAIEVVELPESFTLQGNYPNPFNPTTTIQFNLPASADVEVQVYDMVGRMVMTLPAQNIAAGANRSVQLNASQLASGSYFYRVIARMDSKTFVETGRMLLVK